MQTAISNKVDGIALSCIGEGFADLLTQAKEANIPVVQFDSGVWPKDYQSLEDSGTNPIVSAVLNDNYGGGALAAEHLFEYVKEDIISSTDSYIVGAIQHDETVSAYERTQGFVDKFLELAEEDVHTKGRVEVEIQVKPDVNNNNYKNALDFLREKGARSVFMTAEPVITQIYDAIQSGLSQYNDMIFVGYDAGDRQISWMEENGKPLLLGSIAQDSYKLGYYAVVQAIRASQQKPVEKNITTPGVWWDVNNYQELIEDKIVYHG